MGLAYIQKNGAAAVASQPVEGRSSEADRQVLGVREMEEVGTENAPRIADSVMPKIASRAKIPKRAMVAGMIGSPEKSVPPYSTAVLALITAVATYDKIVKQAAMEALYFVVVFKRALYAPPLRGSASPTSA